jgi:adenine deaminase
VLRALALGTDLFKALQVACINPIDHYGLNVGKLRKGDPADFIVVKDLISFRVVKTFIDGNLVAMDGKTLIPKSNNHVINNFSTEKKLPSDFQLKSIGTNIRVIEALDGQLITNEIIVEPLLKDDLVVSDTNRDILKIVVVNRYSNTSPAVAFVKNFGLKHGAIASSVAHDSHNVIAVGVDDQSIAQAVNVIIEARGGVSVINDLKQMLIPLQVAGLMSDDDGYEIARQYQQLDKMAKDLGCTLSAPFMTLSFMALLVIPSLKLSDKGLFDGNKFQFTHVFKN